MPVYMAFLRSPTDKSVCGPKFRGKALSSTPRDFSLVELENNDRRVRSAAMIADLIYAMGWLGIGLALAYRIRKRQTT
jgi:hypothetical protein